MKLVRLFLTITVLAVFSTAFLTAAEPNAVYELRIYRTNDGKLPVLEKRFREHTCKLFEKHGITNVGYWVPVDKENGSETTLYCLVRHESREAAKKSFAAFEADAEWIKVKNDSEAGGKILAAPPESIYLGQTAYSPVVKTGGAGDKPRAFELRTYKTNPGKLEALHERFTNHTVKLFSRHGMTHIGYWTPLDADKGSSDTLIYFLAHESKDAGLKSFTTFRVDPEWVAAKGESEKNGSLTIPQPNGVKSVYMLPTDFSPLK